VTAPLAGVRVLDLSTLLPGPLATLILAEAGAEVVKIERPGGDELRGFPPPWGEDGVGFALLNRGKRSLTLDLKSELGRARFRELVATSDVLVEQFRPGVMDRLGLGHGALRSVRPNLIYCAITGYGQTGPNRGRAGHDLNYLAESGLLALAMGPPGAWTVPPALIADIAGGAYPAVMSILLALRRRETTGQGAFLDISMTDNLFPLMFRALGSGFATGVWPGNGTDLLTGGSPRYRLYATRDGAALAVAALEERFWQRFAAAIGLEPAWRDDARDPAGTARRIAELVAARDAAELDAALATADCCCSIVRSLEDALATPQIRARRLFEHSVVNAAGARIPALPVPLAPALRRPANDDRAPRLDA
jgi:alpha-methylacyl-CoA racemase